MPRERSLKFARINIVTHPHSPENYVKLLFKVFNLHRSIAVRGEQHLMIGELNNIVDGKPLHGLWGRIYRFTHIDQDATWFNVARKDVATKDELAEIKIPENLRPNCDMFIFVFYPDGHALYVENKSGRQSLSPALVRKMFGSLFSSPDIKEEFGVPEVHVFADREGLEDIFKINRLSKLIIEVTKPNPDELGAAQARVFGRMGGMNARTLKLEITAEINESITADDDTKLTAQVAAAGNGKVVGHGFNKQGKRVEESTIEKPWIGELVYDPNLQAPREALIGATADMPGNG